MIIFVINSENFTYPVVGIFDMKSNFEILKF